MSFHGKRSYRGGRGSNRRGTSGGGSWGRKSNADYKTELSQYLHSLDNKPYSAYKSLQGNQSWKLSGGELVFEKIQPDPYAPASLASFRIPQSIVKYPDHTFSTPERRIATEDFLCRKLFAQFNSPGVYITRPSQCILARNSVLIDEKFLEIRFSIKLPASNGRRIFGSNAADTIETSVVPALTNLQYENISDEAKQELQLHIHSYLDQLQLRSIMKSEGLIAFVANDSILPRESGISDLKLTETGAIAFQSPISLEFSFNLDNHGQISGMGLRKGIHLIVGGGFHGKSTLMSALQKGVYNHIRGDGREFVLADESSVSIQAEDGRSVESVDISPFINNLPGKVDTKRFSTPLASGSTSQATNIIEALEVGSKVLLIDEDRTATNFMCRDRFMSELISDDKEPIFPFITKAQALYKQHDVSSILVIGGLGEYFAIADSVVMMDNYLCRDVTEKAKEIIARDQGSKLEIQSTFGEIMERKININKTLREFGTEKVKANGTESIRVGHDSIDISSVPFEEDGQVKLIEFLLKQIAKDGGNFTLKEIVSHYVQLADHDHSFAYCTPYKTGSLALVRIYELAAAINRYRKLKIQ